jgi:formate hydrogenlyase subunit 6/NADH:ubiquinone oxidoreductase subunit I
MTAAGSGVPEIDLTLCTRCGDCVEACPSGALSMSAEGELAFALELCAYCADCEDVCPVGAIALPFDIVIGHQDEQGDEE